MVVLFAAVHMSLPGTSLPRANATAGEVVVATRNRLLAVPERAASRLGLNRQEVAAVDEEIRPALTELSECREEATS
jgi:hypothetical protein